jgi:hypothetical protein
VDEDVEPLPRLDSPDLYDLLTEVPLATLESSDAVIYATDPDLRIVYANAAWDRFAANNKAAGLVREKLERKPILDSIAGPLREQYGAQFEAALSTGKSVEHLLDCPSSRVSRQIHMRILPLRNGGLLFINSLIAEEPIVCGSNASLDLYLDGNALFTMCSHCRRTRRVDNGAWEWVPELIEHPSEHVSHGLCQVCLQYHYLSRKRLGDW